MKPRFRRLLCLCVPAFLSAGCEASPPSPPPVTIAVWSAALERLGWRLKSDELFGDANTGRARVITYTKPHGALTLHASIMVPSGQRRIDDMSFQCFAPRGIKLVAESVVAAHGVCRSAAEAIVPGAAAATKRATAGSDEVPPDPDGYDLLRSEGRAATGSGWRVTVVDYLERSPRRSEYCVFLITLDVIRPADVSHPGFHSGRNSSFPSGVSQRPARR